MLRAASLGMTMVTSIVLARILGPADFGVYAFALSVVTIVGLPIHMGLPVLVLRETAKGVTHGEYGAVRGLWHWSHKRIAVFTLVVLAIAIPAMMFWGNMIAPEDEKSAIWVGLALVPLIAIAQLRGGAARGLQRPILGLMPDSIVRPLGLVLLLSLAWHSGQTISPGIAMALHVVAAFAASILGIYIVWKIAPRQLRSAKPELANRKMWTAALLPLALLAGVQVMMQNVNVVLLGFFAPPDQVGLFKIALSASALALIGLTAINTVLAPEFVRLHALGNYALLQRKAAQSAIVALAFAAPFAMLFLVLGKPIIELLYGAAYVDAYLALTILLVGALGNAFFGSCTTLLSLAGHERVALKVMSVALAIGVAINLLLTPLFGQIGAAIAASFAMLSWNTALAWSVWAKMGVDCSPFGLLHSNRIAEKSE